MNAPISVTPTCPGCDADLSDWRSVEVTARYGGTLVVRTGCVVAAADSSTVDSEVSCVSCGAVLEVRETDWK